MASLKRYIIGLHKEIIRQETTGRPRWLVVQTSYSDGEEIYELRALEMPMPMRRFGSRSELDAFVFGQRYTVAA
jgi:hypothetical protein